MASQTHLLYRFIILTLCLACLTSRHVSATNPLMEKSDAGNRVDVSVYYESLCPYCANFIVNHLIKIFQTDLINVVNLRLLPWGNTQLQPNDTWICQVPLLFFSLFFFFLQIKYSILYI